MKFWIRISFIFFILFNINHGFAAELKKIEENLSDSVITTKLTAKFTKNKLLNPFKISISTDKGRVTLKGNVRNKAAFIEALKVTKATKGVKSINADHLEIKVVNTAFTDAYITAKVETTILKSKLVDDESIPLVGINAHTKNGIVTLSGKLKSKNAISALIKRISAVKGVKKVVSQMKVMK
jgi:hyperosmotically inducible protein